MKGAGHRTAPAHQFGSHSPAWVAISSLGAMRSKARKHCRPDRRKEDRVDVAGSVLDEFFKTKPNIRIISMGVRVIDARNNRKTDHHD